jgi:hypothetical protein
LFDLVALAPGTEKLPMLGNPDRGVLVVNAEVSSATLAAAAAAAFA